MIKAQPCQLTIVYWLLQCVLTTCLWLCLSVDLIFSTSSLFKSTYHVLLSRTRQTERDSGLPSPGLILRSVLDVRNNTPRCDFLASPTNRPLFSRLIWLRGSAHALIIALAFLFLFSIEIQMNKLLINHTLIKARCPKWLSAPSLFMRTQTIN